MTALAATFQPAAGSRPPRVLLQVTGAPNPPTPVYTANFAATVDGWTGSGTGNTLTWQGFGSGIMLASSVLSGGAVGNVITASKVVTGLTVGVVYRLTVGLARQANNDGTSRLRVTGLTQTAYLAVPAGTGARTTMTLTFTATATSHTINVDQQRTTTGNAETIFVLDAVVAPAATWQGTTIRRTDVNGAGVTVREDQGGQDTSAGTMTLYDLEAALTGPVIYAVTDGAGAVTYASTTLSANPRVNVVPNPSFEGGVTGWQAQGAGTALAATSDDADTGQSCALLTTGIVNGLALRTNVIPLDNPVGKVYATRMRVKATTAVDVSIAARFIQADTATTTTTFTGPTTTLVPNVWTTLYVVATVPALTANVRVQLNKLDTTARTIRVDSVVCQEVPAGATFDPASYFDGSTAGAVWFGTPNNSVSMIATIADTGAGVWLTLPATAVPSAGTVSAVKLELVLDYSETSETNGSLHKIIGRADPIANPGPLSLRTGTLELYCSSYAVAKALRALLAAGEIALIRQPTFAGLDLYAATQGIDIAPAPDDHAPRRWLATLKYAEVLAA